VCSHRRANQSTTILRFGTREENQNLTQILTPISTAQESARGLDQLETAVYCSASGGFFFLYFTCKREVWPPGQLVPIRLMPLWEIKEER
jgi:hypothetical protein